MRNMKFLTRGKLTTILKWAYHCMKSSNYVWTKWDANLFQDVIRERRAVNNEYYINNRHKYVEAYKRSDHIICKLYGSEKNFER